MRKSIVKKLVGVFGIFAIAAIGVAGCHKFGSAEERAAFVHEKLTEKFDLSDQQQAILDKALGSVTAIIKENKSTQKDDFATIRKSIESGETIEPAVFINAYNARRAIIDKHVQQIATSLSELSATLSSEQRKDLLAMLSKVEKRHFR